MFERKWNKLNRKYSYKYFDEPEFMPSIYNELTNYDASSRRFDFQTTINSDEDFFG